MLVKLIAKTIVVDQIPGYIVHPDDENYPTDADDLAEQAGRLCYLAWFRRNPKTANNKGYLKNILDQGHYSVTEHATASFYIEGVSRAFLLELERHRHLSYSVLSQRYVPEDQYGDTMHPVLRKLSDATRTKIALVSARSRELYREIVEELVSLGDGRKTARGAARNVLPEGTETKILVSGNMRAWQEVLWKRLSPAADEEIRQVSALILPYLKEIAPNTFQGFE